MPKDPTPPQTAFEAAAQETLVTSLRNAHALEKQVVSVLESHIKLLDDYPDLRDRLAEHVIETREQARRLEAALEACGSSASVFKDAFLSVMGMGQSSAQGFAEDAVLKAVLADTMTEHLEIASYKTLIVLADMAGKPDLRPRLEESLREEEAMAQWLADNLEAITRRFVDLKEEEDTPTRTKETDSAQTSPTLWQTLEKHSDPRATPTAEAEPKHDTTPVRNPARQPPHPEAQKAPADPKKPAHPPMSAQKSDT